MSTMPEQRELTARGLILGVLITLVFTAANVFFGLKAGLTFSTSIPAAVISMAVLRALRGGNILENNMVQTQASAAGTLSSIIFVLPGLLMMGHWHGFPFWQTLGIFDYGPHWGLVALTVGAALVGIVTFGSLCGSMLPFILKRIGFDPASASAPFVATLVDVTGLVIYFGVAALILRGTLL